MKRLLFLGTALTMVLPFALFNTPSVVNARQAEALMLGPAVMQAQSTYKGFYDGRKDTYLLTDTSNKAQATAWHINYSAALGMIHGQPAQYFVQGRAAAGQIAVFGSEPGEKDYSPLWAEIIVVWKAGTKPVLLTSDNQISALAKKGKLTDKANGIILNAPITKVGK